MSISKEKQAAYDKKRRSTVEFHVYNAAKQKERRARDPEYKEKQLAHVRAWRDAKGKEWLKAYYKKRRIKDVYNIRTRNIIRYASMSEEEKKQYIDRVKQNAKAKPHVYNAIRAKRRAAKLNATPKWADLEAIKYIYTVAHKAGLEVDHIVPLQGKLVCGLHVENNLQLLTRNENTRKGNRYEVV